MLRRRPHRAAPRRASHPATGWVLLAALYLTATIVNAVLAVHMAVLWPAMLAGLLAAVTAACAVVAARRFR